jgi:hypothetical protein
MYPRDLESTVTTSYEAIGSIRSSEGQTKVGANKCGVHFLVKRRRKRGGHGCLFACRCQRHAHASVGDGTLEASYLRGWGRCTLLIYPSMCLSYVTFTFRRISVDGNGGWKSTLRIGGWVACASHFVTFRNAVVGWGQLVAGGEPSASCRGGSRGRRPPPCRNYRKVHAAILLVASRVWVCRFWWRA